MPRNHRDILTPGMKRRVNREVSERKRSFDGRVMRHTLRKMLKESDPRLTATVATNQGKYISENFTSSRDYTFAYTIRRSEEELYDERYYYDWGEDS